MNKYIEKFKSQLPLLKYCDGPSTQEDGIISHLLGLLDLKSNYFVEFGQRSLGPRPFLWCKTRGPIALI